MELLPVATTQAIGLTTEARATHRRPGETGLSSRQKLIKTDDTLGCMPLCQSQDNRHALRYSFLERGRKESPESK